MNVKKGFTLIELLIVMAILGVLAVVVLVAINPVQQLARTRDAGRKSAITQIGHALEAYYTTQGATYVAESTTWIDDLVAAGEMASVPSAIAYGSGFTPCTGAGGGIQNDYCYYAQTAQGGPPMVVLTRLESDSEVSKCGDPADFCALFVWSSADGRGGLVCDDSTDGCDEPIPGSMSFTE